jgi:hypothetical protein
MQKMAFKLQLSVEELTGLLAKLIAADKLAAKIDTATSTVYRQKTNDRRVIQEKLVALGKTQLRDLKAILLRLSMMRHGFNVESDQAISNQPSIFARAQDELELAAHMDLQDSGDDDISIVDEAQGILI